MKLAEAERLVAIYRDPDIRNHEKAQALAEKFVTLGLSEFLNFDDNRPSPFIVYSRQWQAVVFDRLFRAPSSQAIGAMDVIESFSKSRWPKEGIAYTRSGHSKWIAANVAEKLKSPYEEGLACLMRLQNTDAVYQVPGKRFVMSFDLTAASEKPSIPSDSMQAASRPRLNESSFRDLRLGQTCLWTLQMEINRRGIFSLDQP